MDEANVPISKEEAYKQLAQAIEMINKMRYAAEKLAAQHDIPMGASRYGLAYEMAVEDPHGELRRITSPDDLGKLANQIAFDDDESELPYDDPNYLERVADPDEEWVSSSVCW